MRSITLVFAVFLTPTYAGQGDLCAPRHINREVQVLKRNVTNHEIFYDIPMSALMVEYPSNRDAQREIRLSFLREPTDRIIAYPEASANKGSINSGATFFNSTDDALVRIYHGLHRSRTDDITADQILAGYVKTYQNPTVVFKPVLRFSKNFNGVVRERLWISSNQNKFIALHIKCTAL